MACKCKRKIGMARRSSKSVTITTEDVAMAGLGALAGLGVNFLANRALANQPEETKNMARKALPAAKVVGGGYLAINKKQDRRVRFFGLGIAGTGSIELGSQVAPQYFAISGVGDADVFALIGSPSVSIPIAPAKPIEMDEPMLETESILGTYDDDLMVL